MSHHSSINKWLKMSEKEREKICKVAYGSRMVPDKIPGTELDRIFKKVENEIDIESFHSPKAPDGWGNIPR